MIRTARLMGIPRILKQCDRLAVPISFRNRT